MALRQHVCKILSGAATFLATAVTPLSGRAQQPVTLSLYHESSRAPLSVPSSIYDWRKEFHSQLVLKFTNQLSAPNLIGYLQQQEMLRSSSSEVLGKPGRNIFLSAAKTTFRTTAVHRMQLDSLLDDVLPEKMRSVIERTLEGKEDSGTLVSPFDTSEGLPGSERIYNGEYANQSVHSPRLPKHWDSGVKLWRTNPYGYYTLHTTPFDFGARAYLEGVEVVADVPLMHDFVFTTGVRCDQYSLDRGYTFVGLNKYTRQGYFSFGTRVPIQSGKDNAPWTVLSYTYWFK